MSTFYKNYLRQCAIKGVSPSAAALAIGLSRTSANGWKNGKMPSSYNLSKLADYFGVAETDLTDDKKMSAVERIKFILSKRNIPLHYMEAKLDLEPDYINNIEGDIPADVLDRIADYLSCTPEFLLHGYEKKPDTPNGVELNPNYFKLSPENKAIIDSMIAKLVMSQSVD